MGSKAWFVPFLYFIVLALPGLNGAEHLSLVWLDEFEYVGLPDAGKWGYDVGVGSNGWGNRESQYYTQNREENARVENGVLVIEARREAFQNRRYTSARVISKNKGDWKYGRFEIRAKLPRGRGTWPAIWMLPTDWVYGGWPDSGEIDIMEHVGYNMHHIHGSIHTGRFNHLQGTQISSSLRTSNVDTEFHVYAMEWRPDRIDIFLDGQRYFTVSNDGSGFEAWPFDQRFHLLMNIAVGGNWGGVQGIDDSIFPQRMEIDYVRVYSIEDSDHPNFQTVPGGLKRKISAISPAFAWRKPGIQGAAAMRVTWRMEIGPNTPWMLPYPACMPSTCGMPAQEEPRGSNFPSTPKQWPPSSPLTPPEIGSRGEPND